MNDHLATNWAERFGLALAPLFGHSDAGSEHHHVLLDGGLGSFALSVGEAAQASPELRSSWAWSGNLPHHVAVIKDRVSVSRWDRPEVEVLTLASVERRLESFYEYLIADRVRSNKRVVDHLMGLFRRVRSLVAEASLPDGSSTEAYLTFLEMIGDSDKIAAFIASSQTSSAGEETLKRFSLYSLKSLSEYAMASEVLSRSLKLFPGLAVRHAGSEVFQEAHFELIRSPASDLFGYVGPAEARTASRGGAHFTPPALARTLCEQTLAELGDLSTRRELTVMDPACGSGAFLHETMRTLRRLSFNGKLRLVGWDISAAAAAMAEFVVRHAARDWMPEGGLEWEIRAEDSLSADLPNADVVLMNPPFISWVAMSAAQQDQMRSILKADLSGRGDFSMAFVTKAILSLAPGGVLGVLLPSSILSLQSAESWRGSLLDKAALRLIAALGDHGLFAHALVSVAALVLKVRQEKGELTPVTALVTANTTDATGEALRAVRREDPSVSGTLHTPSWRLFSLPETVFRSRPTWRLTSPETESVISRVLESGALSVEMLFDVRQGVLTGFNKAFLLSADELGRLPAVERRYFRPATVNESIARGRVSPTHFVFYPHTKNGDLFASENELREAVPIYFRQYLKPNETELKARANISRSNRADWWGLSEKRAWALSSTPRIITKYFGDAGGFAVDIDAEYLVVQGYAWIPKWLTSDPEDYLTQSGDRTLLYAYSALFNSRSFGTLVEAFSPHVAGGQFNLSPRYVKPIPIPNLPSLMLEDHAGSLILRLAELGKAPDMDSASWHTMADRLVATLYGGSLTSEQ